MTSETAGMERIRALGKLSFNKVPPKRDSGQLRVGSHRWLGMNAGVAGLLLAGELIGEKGRSMSAATAVSVEQCKWCDSERGVTRMHHSRVCTSRVREPVGRDFFRSGPFQTSVMMHTRRRIVVRVFGDG